MSRLSKSRVMAGWQCPKLLWWQVHEPEARELQPDQVLRDLFDQGRQVGERAREEFPGGVLIDRPHDAYADRLAATQAALAGAAPAVFEACFEAHGVFVSVDVLLRAESGWTLIEVKSSTSLKDEHRQETAAQVWVAREAGVAITGAEVMHLNREYRIEGAAPLFLRADVTAEVEALIPTVPPLAAELAAMLEGRLPDRPVGAHCFEPRECPFMDRCWPDDPHHIRHLYRVGPKRTVSYMAQGVHRIWDLPPQRKPNPIVVRQLCATREDRLVVEPALRDALGPFEPPLGYLDFETVARAVPVWPGLAPWGAAIAQFSFHADRPDGSHEHTGWLAEGPGDPSREAAERMLAATAGVERIVTYSAYEKTRIRELGVRVPGLAGPLAELEGKLLDLLPVVRNHVYHPAFQGSFSLKYILTPLVPDLGYEDLVIVDGRTASVEIARLLFVAHRIPPAERDRVRHDLLAYCERDTWATVRLLQRLRELAAGA